MTPSCLRIIASRPDQRLGQHESATNEVWLKDFDAYLKQHHNSSVEALAAQWRSIIKEAQARRASSWKWTSSSRRWRPGWTLRLHGRQRAQGLTRRGELVHAIAEALADEFREGQRCVSRGGLVSRRNGAETAFVRVE